MVHLAPIRKLLAFPTVFNALGPLINPINPKRLIVGVHSEYLGPVFAEALRLGGVEKAWVVCGKEGLDEISIAGETDVRPSLFLSFLSSHSITETLALSLGLGSNPNQHSTIHCIPLYFRIRIPSPLLSNRWFTLRELPTSNLLTLEQAPHL